MDLRRFFSSIELPEANGDSFGREFEAFDTECRYD